jgi:Rrf2 family protein
MIVSTKGRYALRVMIDIAQHPDNAFTPLKEIAERQDMSEKYLEAILKILVKNELVVGLRGKKGGYQLSRDPRLITVWDVLSVTEKELSVVSCLSPGAVSCEKASECHTLPMWQEFNTLLRLYFSRFTIQDLADGVPALSPEDLLQILPGEGQVRSAERKG